MIEKIADWNLALWLKLILPIATKFLPGWVSAALMVLIEIIEGLPKDEKKQAKQELKAAGKRYKKSKDVTEIAGVIKKYHKRYCDGPDCELTEV